VAAPTHSATITTADSGGSGLKTANSYQYQLGDSNTVAPTETWSSYTSGTAVTLGPDLTGDYYLWVKQIADNAGNVSVATTGAYTVAGPFVFEDPTPVATSLSPTQGLTDLSDEVITITGVNFTDASDVTVGDEPCVSFLVVDDTTISCVLPTFDSESAGVKDVIVTTPNGVNLPDSDSQYTVIAQYVSLSVAPDVAISVYPKRFSSGKATVTASTNSPTGYNLSLMASSPNLTRTTTPFDTIPILAGYTDLAPAAPGVITSLVGNTSFWGYRIDNAGAFGAGTAPESDQPGTAYSWATVPSEDTIVWTGPTTDDLTTNTPQDTDVWFGASPTYEKTSGEYRVKLTFTGLVAP
jgi:hypothetical protein